MNIKEIIKEVEKLGNMCKELLSDNEKGVKLSELMPGDRFDTELGKECLKYIQEMANSLGLSLNGKTQIVPFSNGIRFLGFHHYVTSDGKYIRKLTGENKRRIKRKILKWCKAVKDGKMTEKKFFEKYEAWKNHALHGNCIKLCRSMDIYVNKLIGGG